MSNPTSHRPRILKTFKMMEVGDKHVIAKPHTGRAGARVLVVVVVVVVVVVGVVVVVVVVVALEVAIAA